MHKKTLGLVLCVMLGASSLAGAAQMENRESLSFNTMEQLFGAAASKLAGTDPEFAAYRDRLIYGDIYHHLSLSAEQMELVQIAVLTSVGAFDDAERHVTAALNVGVDPVKIKEAVYQCAPYIGIPKTEATLERVNKVFTERGIKLPLESQAAVNDATRFEAGKKLQVDTYGERLRRVHENTPANQQYLNVYLLASYCFGDTQTRKGLNMTERELLTFALIASLGGAEGQLTGHTKAALDTGNTKQNLIDCLSLIMPYMGFPRTLNALAVVNKVSPEPEAAK